MNYFSFLFDHRENFLHVCIRIENSTQKQNVEIFVKDLTLFYKKNLRLLHLAFFFGYLL